MHTAKKKRKITKKKSSYNDPFLEPAMLMETRFRHIFTWREKNSRTTTIIRKTSNPLIVGQLPTRSKDMERAIHHDPSAWARGNDQHQDHSCLDPPVPDLGPRPRSDQGDLEHHARCAQRRTTPSSSPLRWRSSGRDQVQPHCPWPSADAHQPP
jgi:hypothetical protein